MIFNTYPDGPMSDAKRHYRAAENHLREFATTEAYNSKDAQIRLPMLLEAADLEIKMAEIALKYGLLIAREI